jgi:hypothetical protein
VKRGLKALHDFAPTVLVVWPETFVSSQFAIWEPYLTRSAHRIAVLARNHSGGARPESTIPFVCEDEDGVSLADVASIESISVILYPTVRLRFRKHINAFASCQHVFIGHGDSDKASSARARNRIFDWLFVADSEAIDRYPRGAIPRERFVEIGAPLLDGLLASTGTEPVKTVLYAPTWEGHDPDNDFTSIPVVAAAIRNTPSRLAGLALEFLPHPGAGHHSSIVRESKDELVAQFGQVYRADKVAAFNRSDGLVTDISGVLTEYLATRKPIVVIDTDTARFRAALAQSTLHEVVELWNPATETLSAAFNRANTPERAAARQRAAERKFHGATSISDAVKVFDRAVSRVNDASNMRGLQASLRTMRKRTYKLNPVTAAKAVARFVLRRPSRPVS